MQAAIGKSIDLGFEASPEPVYASGDPISIEEMIANVIDNAVRYTPPGGKISVVLEAENSGLCLRVSDTGFSPGDDFCTLWHFFDLLPGGVGNWPTAAKKPSCCTSG